jgi:hypothetical protein
LTPFGNFQDYNKTDFVIGPIVLLRTLRVPRKSQPPCLPKNCKTRTQFQKNDVDDSLDFLNHLERSLPESYQQFSDEDCAYLADFEEKLMKNKLIKEALDRHETEVAQPFLEELHANLLSRFPDHPIMFALFKLFSPMLTSSEERESPNWNSDAIATIQKHFGEEKQLFSGSSAVVTKHLVNSTTLLVEWGSVKAVWFRVAESCALKLKIKVEEVSTAQFIFHFLKTYPDGEFCMVKNFRYFQFILFSVRRRLLSTSVDFLRRSRDPPRAGRAGAAVAAVERHVQPIILAAAAGEDEAQAERPLERPEPDSDWDESESGDGDDAPVS